MAFSVLGAAKNLSLQTDKAREYVDLGKANGLYAVCEVIYS